MANKNEQHKKEDLIETTAVVTEAMPSGYFRVRVAGTESIALCHVCGKIRKNSIKVIPGDDVIIELSPYDLKRGRITRVIRKRRDFQNEE